MTIDVEELRRAANCLLDHLVANGHRSVDLDRDYYWHVPHDVRYDPYRHPPPDSLTLGQLSDDWKEVQRIASGDREAFGWALVWLAALLRAVGEKVAD